MVQRSQRPHSSQSKRHGSARGGHTNRYNFFHMAMISSSYSTTETVAHTWGPWTEPRFLHIISLEISSDSHLKELKGNFPSFLSPCPLLSAKINLMERTPRPQAELPGMTAQSQPHSQGCRQAVGASAPWREGAPGGVGRSPGLKGWPQPGSRVSINRISFLSIIKIKASVDRPPALWSPRVMPSYKAISNVISSIKLSNPTC